MSILVAQPRNPRHPPALHAVADRLLDRLYAANVALEFDIQVDDSPVIVPDDSPIYSRHAIARNRLIDTRLRPEHTHVLWIDSDLIDYRADLPLHLWVASDEGQHIVAPVALLDWHDDHTYPDWAMNGPNRFYDIGGFIENGKPARLFPPWFDQVGRVSELDSVGCCYLIPSWIYREGARYAPPGFSMYRRWSNGSVAPFCVEHYSVMRYAKEQGVRILALHDLRVTHAWLPDYGLEPN